MRACKVAEGHLAASLLFERLDLRGKDLYSNEGNKKIWRRLGLPCKKGGCRSPLTRSRELAMFLDFHSAICNLLNTALWLPYKEYSREDAEEAMYKANIALKVTEDFLADWFLTPDSCIFALCSLWARAKRARKNAFESCGEIF